MEAYKCLVIGILALTVSCVSTIKDANLGKQKTVFLCEGLGSIPYVKNSYKDEMENLGYVVYASNWKQKGAISASVCIGHSFCGGRLMKNDVKCGIVITLDAREWNFSNNDSYVSQHAKHFNFYQTTPLRGYPIVGAINKEVTSTSHTRLPAAVKDLVMETIKQQTKP